jgi:hypothetical protein
MIQPIGGRLLWTACQTTNVTMEPFSPLGDETRPADSEPMKQKPTQRNFREHHDHSFAYHSSCRRIFSSGNNPYNSLLEKTHDAVASNPKIGDCVVCNSMEKVHLIPLMI